MKFRVVRTINSVTILCSKEEPYEEVQEKELNAISAILDNKGQLVQIRIDNPIQHLPHSMINKLESDPFDEIELESTYDQINNLAYISFELKEKTSVDYTVDEEQPFVFDIGHDRKILGLEFLNVNSNAKFLKKK